MRSSGPGAGSAPAPTKPRTTITRPASGAARRRGRPRRRAAPEAGRVIVVRGFVGAGAEPAPGPELLMGAEETAHEDAVARPGGLFVAFDLLGREPLQQRVVHGVAHPLVE